MSLEIIKKLRDETGAGMVDIKNALEEAGGSEAKAVEILRKSGQKIAAKKSGRSTAEGVIAIERSGQRIAAVVLACETDFVARNENFVRAARDFAKKLLNTPAADFKSWAEAEIQNNLIVKIGENIQLKEFVVIQGEVLGSYLHSNSKAAAVVVLEGGDEAKAKEAAMQAVAMNPSYLGPEDVPAEILEKEKEIYREQLKKEGKPKEMIEKILTGKIQKFYAEVCLVKQPYIKDDKINVEKFLGGAKIKEFRRFSL